jgi:hypothetical protein
MKSFNLPRPNKFILWFAAFLILVGYWSAVNLMF